MFSFFLPGKSCMASLKEMKDCMNECKTQWIVVEQSFPKNVGLFFWGVRCLKLQFFCSKLFLFSNIFFDFFWGAFTIFCQAFSFVLPKKFRIF